MNDSQRTTRAYMLRANRGDTAHTLLQQYCAEMSDTGADWHGYIRDVDAQAATMCEGLPQEAVMSVRMGLGLRNLVRGITDAALLQKRLNAHTSGLDTAKTTRAHMERRRSRR